MSVREFAAHLGVSDRMVSKWEAGGRSIRPRPVNQAALDTSLSQAPSEVRTRFADLSNNHSVRLLRQRMEAQPALAHLIRHPDDAKLMTLVDAGMYRSGPQARPAWLSGYYIDVYPTTNADYARFVEATGRRPPQSWPRGECPSRLLTHPVVMVDWYDAQAYATWAAKALPTVAEWEKATRGAHGLAYPWGDHPSTARCNVRESRVTDTTPVDWYDNGVSPYGVYDLCGNVWEWCVTEAGSGLREVRGGSFATPMRRALEAPDPEPESTRRRDAGFRCVLSVPDMLQLLSI